jgi:asparagine synthase (glutamine-hydrolysing)
MPGLVGIVSTQPLDGLDRALQRMIESVRHCAWHKVEHFVAPQRTFACAQVHLGIFPTEHSPYRWLHGEETDSFTRVEFDEGAQVLTITNDAFGMMPLFYHCASGRFVFATEMKAVLAVPGIAPLLDPRGLADLLSFGFIFGEKTLVTGVRCLPGGARLQFNARTGAVTLGRTWDIRRQMGRGAGTDMAGLADAFRRAVQRRATGKLQIGVSLSGGYDSRTIHAAIDHQRVAVKTLTLDVRGGADQVLAEQIARATNGIENHTFIENSDAFFAKWPSYVREMVWLTDGQFFDEACVMMSTLDTYRQLGIQVALRGHGGEIARMQSAYELTCNRHILACRSQTELMRQLQRQMTCGLDEADLAGLLTLDLAGMAEATFGDAFAGIAPDWHPVDQVTCVYAQEYLRRQSVPSLAELRSRVEVRLPFLDTDYVRAVLQLRPEHRLGAGVHRHLLAEFNPALLRIINSNTGSPAGSSDLVQRLHRKLNIYLKRYLGYERFKHYVDVPAWLRGPLRKPVETVLLDDRTLSRGLYRPDAVRAAVQAHMAGHANRGAALLLLLYVELWQRLFVEGESWRS